LKIDKAIQDNDLREYFRETSDQEKETPLEQRCQTFNAPSADAAFQMFDRSNENNPAIAILNQPNFLTVSTTPEFSFISMTDCNVDGVRKAQEDLRAAVRRYHRVFLELSRLRESYAENNDLFATQLIKLRQELSYEGKMGRAQIIYYHIKKTIEAGIAQFLTQISEITGVMQRLQRIAIGRRMGWGYLRNSPSANFVVVVRHPSLLFGMATPTSLINIPENWIPSDYRTTPRPEFIKRSTTDIENSNNTYFNKYLSPVHSNCIVNVTSLKKFSDYMANGRNETFEIFALQEEDEMLLMQIDHLSDFFDIWHRTTGYWFTSQYWRYKLMHIAAKFSNLLYDLRNPYFNQTNDKRKAIQELTNKIKSIMKSGWDWYYKPENVYENLDKLISDHLVIVRNTCTKC
jgi:hypothetical protein